MRTLTPARTVSAAAFTHGPEIMLGMLKVIFCRYKIAALGFGASQLQIAFVFPLRILGMPREVNVRGLAFG